MLDLTFVDLVAKMQRKFSTVKGYIILTDRQHMPKNSKLQNMLCYEDLLQVLCPLFPSQPLPSFSCPLAVLQVQWQDEQAIACTSAAFGYSYDVNRMDDSTFITASWTMWLPVFRNHLLGIHSTNQCALIHVHPNSRC